MELLFLKETIPSLLNKIPAPVIVWGFAALIIIVFIVLFKKVGDLRGE